MINANELSRQLALDLARAILAAAAADPQVEACRARARAAGFDIRGSLEDMIAAAIRFGRIEGGAGDGAPAGSPHALELTRSDIRLLRTLRIAVDRTTEPA
jgi:hypothetical protein